MATDYKLVMKVFTNKNLKPGKVSFPAESVYFGGKAPLPLHMNPEDFGEFKLLLANFYKDKEDKEKISNGKED